ncbi:cytochrome b5-like [Oppia nitens]|uniref:cytochrome b5-like n=1 Tax=Oppia nitens TaxID=1686743 RepID=UPI0023D9BEFE|nr:cytochrome b5-like [Oppia nitens]
MLEKLQNFVSNMSSTTNSWLYSSQESKTPCLPHNSWRNLPQYTLSQVSEHCHYNDCWLIIYDLVYDVTNFLAEHPGGEYIVMESAGRDATLVFRGSRHSKDATDMLDKYCIGILVENERIYTPNDDELNIDSQT